MELKELYRVEKPKEEIKPKVVLAKVTVRNDSKQPLGFYDRQNREIKVSPGQKKTAVVRIEEAHRLGDFFEMLKLEQLPEDWSANSYIGL